MGTPAHDGKQVKEMQHGIDIWNDHCDYPYRPFHSL